MSNNRSTYPTYAPGKPTPCFHFEGLHIQATENVLTEFFQTPVRLGVCERIYANSEDKKNLRRCFVTEGPRKAPTSLIFKRFDCFEAYDLSDVSPETPAWRCFNEWAATQFLQSFANTPPFAPRCFGGDRVNGFVLLEDVGRGHDEAAYADEMRVLLNWTVAAHLRGADPISAEAGLLAYSAVLGQMHSATVGKEEEFNRLLADLSPRRTDYRTHETNKFRHDVERLRLLSEQLGLSWRGIASEAEAIGETMRAPGPYLAFTHGEYCPNELYFTGTVRLYDFEYSGFRHALTDGIYRRQLLPWCRHRLPESLLQQTEVVYRDALRIGCSAANDDREYNRARTEVWVWRDVFQLVSQLPKALDKNGNLFENDVDQELGPSPSPRQRIMLVLESLADMTAQHAHLPAFERWAREMAAQLRLLWNPEPFTLSLYPAFR